MNEYAWHYLNLSMDNTSRCHIYLFPSACIQGSVRVGFSQIMSKFHHHLHHMIPISLQSNHSSSITPPPCVQRCFASQSPRTPQASASSNQVMVLIPTLVSPVSCPWSHVPAPPQSHSVACFSLICKETNCFILY